MKNSKPAKTAAEAKTDELRAEYRFDYSKSRPNRFAAESKSAVVVMLAPDVAPLFPDAHAVNEALRVIASVAKRAAPKVARRKSAA